MKGAILRASSDVPKKSRNALPRYVRCKRLAYGALAYFFDLPTWARSITSDDERGPCPVESEALGSDYSEAVARAGMLLAAFDSWRSQGLTDIAVARGKKGTFDWLVSDYRASEKFTKLSASQKANHELGFSIVADYELKDGRRFGSLPLAEIDTGVTDRLFEKLLTVEERQKDGTVVKRVRRTTVNHAMKSCRRAWFVAKRRNPKLVPSENPFSKMGLTEAHRPTPTATWEDLQAFIAYCDKHGRASLATAALVAWEWWQREEDILLRFTRDDYRPKQRSTHAQVVHNKTGEKVWIPLSYRNESLYPELMERLDAAAEGRIGAGPLLVRDWIDPVEGVPVPWVTKSGKVDYFRHEVKRMIIAAGLSSDLSFRSFRHGGFTESGDAELTDAEVRAQSRQRSNVLPVYIKSTDKQLVNVAKKRRAARTKGGGLSE